MNGSPRGAGIAAAALNRFEVGRRTLTAYLTHRNEARPHRALGQLTPTQVETSPPTPINLADYRIRRKSVLGGLTREYQIAF